MKAVAQYQANQLIMHKEATMLHSEYLAAIKLVMDDASYKDCPDCGGEGIHEHDCPGGCRRCNYLGYIACGSCEGTGRVPKDPEQFEATADYHGRRRP